MRFSLLPVLLALCLSPLLLGVINCTKAVIAGRVGPPILQVYYDLWKLLRKGAVYSKTTTWLFRAGPIVGLAAVLTAALLVPLGGIPALVSFPGDLILFAYLLGLARFVTVVAALDTGSSFEGMGASREVLFSALAEPALLLALAAIAKPVHSYSLSEMFHGLDPMEWTRLGTVLALSGSALLIVLLAENARIPVDDPNTHLELTMIHEVMVLDHGGPDFAFIQYGAALKLWVLGSLLVGVALPLGGLSLWLQIPLACCGMFLLAVLVGLIESTMARLRLVVVPQLLVGASVLAGVALLLVLHKGS